jgi:hypothetical protein
MSSLHQESFVFLILIRFWEGPLRVLFPRDYPINPGIVANLYPETRLRFGTIAQEPSEGSCDPSLETLCKEGYLSKVSESWEFEATRS